MGVPEKVGLEKLIVPGPETWLQFPVPFTGVFADKTVLSKLHMDWGFPASDTPGGSETVIFTESHPESPQLLLLQ